ncbi:group III truncated hemoglobin [Flavilitoribacter nigricans]|uniref:Globin n=1 Tax=Flavilitoribacter nigricans (strain ATCC 23147 / DSM 23189 / NBRC 102662 / NCIMB 1420 / SS-2) TaxID=1122177 RepID=A0A2D0NIP5_FLAN2|nr:group III truncated hemoglobin [Flavilitoribacter nigricans]PHN08362.1 globin [Flavilitoribacter nigricans DSM 23189 = NBRC 102662]
MKREIQELKDIQQLVDTFYEKVRTDDLLGPIFNGVIRDRWPMHLQKMYNFWQTVLLKEHTYNGRPFPPHYQLPVDARHFEHWLHLFSETVDELFTGEKATEAKWRAQKMAEMFQYKIAYFRGNSSGPLV